MANTLRCCSSDFNTTLTIKKNSSGTFFFLLESLLSLSGITLEIEELLSIKNWCGMQCKGEKRGICKECLIGLWCAAQTGP